MTKYPQQMMEELFDAYYAQCPSERIRYAIYNESKTQAHIVLDKNIELIHFTNYQGQYAIKFAICRLSEEFFFDTYEEALKHLEMPLEEFENYSLSITL